MNAQNILYRYRFLRLFLRPSHCTGSVVAVSSVVTALCRAVCVSACNAVHTLILLFLKSSADRTIIDQT